MYPTVGFAISFPSHGKCDNIKKKTSVWSSRVFGRILGYVIHKNVEGKKKQVMLLL